MSRTMRIHQTGVERLELRNVSEELETEATKFGSSLEVVWAFAHDGKEYYLKRDRIARIEIFTATGWEDPLAAGAELTVADGGLDLAEAEL